MRTTLLILFWALLLASCKEFSFKTPQPAGIKALTEIPSALQGHYLSFDEISGDESDTLIIEAWGYHFKDTNDKDWLGAGHLSDSLVVKFYKNYYFINFKSGDQWVLRLIRQKSYGGIEFLSIDIQDDAKRKEILKKMGKEVAIKEIHRGDDTYYQIAPTPDQLMKLIDKGFFTGSELSKIK
ncbi:MAG: hypothetical protein WAU36_09090 [Cyclobacteriaceae bacterium]